ncbi:uncharacterized protein LOC103524116 [Trichonephila clavipes]|uniref:Uncharacterized protein LOC103524116 n=1 Tax=Trichonephila clavipes TaxID=2585209 RepID=A0A8X6RF95_TRICX|nr:uncharacterized protein LOC103524116 [Trichonephila clavipes]
MVGNLYYDSKKEEWISAHCDIAGNERADFLAKKGALVMQRPTGISTYNSLRLFSNMAFKYNFKIKVAEMSKDQLWAILNENPFWDPGASRKPAVPHFRLLTGHDCLRSHRYRIGIAESPDCTLCDSGPSTITEHLSVCPALISLNSTVEKHWRARALMTQMLL